MNENDEPTDVHSSLIVELSSLFAKDETEHANLLATELLRSHLSAESVALFYGTLKNGYRYCLSGSPFPIGITAERWKECLHVAEQGRSVHLFGPWTLPGFEMSLRYWISLRLYGSEEAPGYLLLGRNSEEWTTREKNILFVIAGIIAAIVGIRTKKKLAEVDRFKAEQVLLEKEKRLRNLFNGSPDMIYTADALDRITDINLAGIRLLGVKDASEVVGRQVSSLATSPEGRQFVLQRVKEHGFSADNEVILKRDDGSTMFCIESTTTLRDGKGNIVEVQGIVKDITQRIMSERELWRSTLELVDVNKKLQLTQSLMVQQEKLASIGQLAAGVAHEINNPLGFLKSNQTMLEKYIKKIEKAWRETIACDCEKVREIDAKNRMDEIFADLEMIAKESEDGFNRIMRIVTDLKSFSRIDQGSGFEMVDVNAGIESTLSVAWNEIKYVAEVTKKFDALPNIRARGNELNQVILNILVNAAQAIQNQNRKEKGQIEISTRLRGDTIRIEIGDDGPGIPETTQTRIFEPFYTTKEPGKGTGLGLSISYNIIVNKHGGKLYIDKKRKVGTCFIIELPVDGPVPAEPEAPIQEV